MTATTVPSTDMSPTSGELSHAADALSGRATAPTRRRFAATLHADELLRRCLLGLAAASVVGAVIELAMIRHWKDALQLVPWAAFLVLGVMIAAMARHPSRIAVRTVRGASALVALVAIVGVVAHLNGNYESGPLDYRYMETWATMSEAAKWWAAISKTVGPAPPIAPGVLAQAALAVFFATLRHPAMANSSMPRDNE
jgi:hypothetical protein